MILAAILLGSAVVVILLAIFAPEGWEDENGFNLGRQPFEHGSRSLANRDCPAPPLFHSFHESGVRDA